MIIHLSQKVLSESRYPGHMQSSWCPSSTGTQYSGAQVLLVPSHCVSLPLAQVCLWTDQGTHLTKGLWALDWDFEDIILL